MSSVDTLEIEQIDNPKTTGKPLLDNKLEIIKNVKVKLEVRIGEAELSVDELMNLSQSSVVQLNRSVETPVDLVLDGKVVARGHLVAADDNFGIQISELIS